MPKNAENAKVTAFSGDGSGRTADPFFETVRGSTGEPGWSKMLGQSPDPAAGKKTRAAARLERIAGMMLNPAMECRPQCGACCIAPSISSPIPGMPDGKPAGIPCAQLLSDYRCALFGQPERPAVCVSLQPIREMCRITRAQALCYLTELEQATRPAARRPARSALRE